MSRIKKTLLYILVLIGIFPEVLNAQVTGTSRLYEMIIDFRGLLGLAVPLIFGLSLVYFFWGTANFILSAGNEKTRRDGINKMIWGVVALFVFVSLYGILGVLQRAINL